MVKYEQNRVRTDSSSESDHGLIWVKLDQTELAGVDIHGLEVTRLIGINLLSIVYV